MTDPTRPPPTDLVAWRQSLEGIRSGAELLDAIISPADAEKLVRALPSDDLHALIHRIGLEDCVDLLSMASNDQVRDIVDGEAWTKDRLSIERIDPWLHALMHTGQDALAERLLSLDDELLNWIVRRTAVAQVIEDPEDYDAPDVEHVTTPDNRMVIMFPAGDEERERDLPVKLFLDWLMRYDMAMCINLLLASTVALDSSLEEDAWRWRKARMADRGYVDYYDALAIYAAPPRTVERPARRADPHAGRRWLGPVLGPDARLAAAFARFEGENLSGLQAEVAYVANQCLSADQVELWDEAGAAAVMARLRAGLVLGLDALSGADGQTGIEADVRVIENTPLSTVFRHGYGKMLEAVAPARSVRRKLAGPDGPVFAVDLPELRDWAEALVAERHPRHPDGGPLSGARLAAAQVAARQIQELSEVCGAERPAEVGFAAWLVTAFARALLGRPGFGPLAPEEVQPALAALRDPAVDTAAWTAWYFERGGADPRLAAALAFQAKAVLGALDPATFDPRAVPLLYVAG